MSQFDYDAFYNDLSNAVGQSKAVLEDQGRHFSSGYTTPTMQDANGNYMPAPTFSLSAAERSAVEKQAAYEDAIAQGALYYTNNKGIPLKNITGNVTADTILSALPLPSLQAGSPYEVDPRDRHYLQAGLDPNDSHAFIHDYFTPAFAVDQSRMSRDYGVTDAMEGKSFITIVDDEGQPIGMYQHNLPPDVLASYEGQMTEEQFRLMKKSMLNWGEEAQFKRMPFQQSALDIMDKKDYGLLPNAVIDALRQDERRTHNEVLRDASMMARRRVIGAALNGEAEPGAIRTLAANLQTFTHGFDSTLTTASPKLASWLFDEAGLDEWADTKKSELDEINARFNFGREIEDSARWGEHLGSFAGQMAMQVGLAFALAPLGVGRLGSYILGGAGYAGSNTYVQRLDYYQSKGDSIDVAKQKARVDARIAFGTVAASEMVIGGIGRFFTRSPKFGQYLTNMFAGDGVAGAGARFFAGGFREASQENLEEILNRAYFMYIRQDEEYGDLVATGQFFTDEFIEQMKEIGIVSFIGGGAADVAFDMATVMSLDPPRVGEFMVLRSESNPNLKEVIPVTEENLDSLRKRQLREFREHQYSYHQEPFGGAPARLAIRAFAEFSMMRNLRRYRAVLRNRGYTDAQIDPYLESVKNATGEGFSFSTIFGNPSEKIGTSGRGRFTSEHKIEMYTANRPFAEFLLGLDSDLAADAIMAAAATGDEDLVSLMQGLENDDIVELRGIAAESKARVEAMVEAAIEGVSSSASDLADLADTMGRESVPQGLTPDEEYLMRLEDELFQHFFNSGLDIEQADVRAQSIVNQLKAQEELSDHNRSDLVGAIGEANLQELLDTMKDQNQPVVQAPEGVTEIDKKGYKEFEWGTLGPEQTWEEFVSGEDPNAEDDADGPVKFSRAEATAKAESAVSDAKNATEPGDAREDSGEGFLARMKQRLFLSALFNRGEKQAALVARTEFTVTADEDLTAEQLAFRETLRKQGIVIDFFSSTNDVGAAAVYNDETGALLLNNRYAIDDDVMSMLIGHESYHHAIRMVPEAAVEFARSVSENDPDGVLQAFSQAISRETEGKVTAPESTALQQWHDVVKAAKEGDPSAAHLIEETYAYYLQFMAQAEPAVAKRVLSSLSESERGRTIVERFRSVLQNFLGLSDDYLIESTTKFLEDAGIPGFKQFDVGNTWRTKTRWDKFRELLVDTAAFNRGVAEPGVAEQISYKMREIAEIDDQVFGVLYPRETEMMDLGRRLSGARYGGRYRNDGRITDPADTPSKMDRLYDKHFGERTTLRPRRMRADQSQRHKLHNMQKQTTAYPYKLFSPLDHAQKRAQLSALDATARLHNLGERSVGQFENGVYTPKFSRAGMFPGKTRDLDATLETGPIFGMPVESRDAVGEDVIGEQHKNIRKLTKEGLGEFIYAGADHSADGGMNFFHPDFHSDNAADTSDFDEYWNNADWDKWNEMVLTMVKHLQEMGVMTDEEANAYHANFSQALVDTRDTVQRLYESFADADGMQDDNLPIFGISTESVFTNFYLSAIPVTYSALEFVQRIVDNKSLPKYLEANQSMMQDLLLTAPNQLRRNLITKHPPGMHSAIGGFHTYSMDMAGYETTQLFGLYGAPALDQAWWDMEVATNPMLKQATRVDRAFARSRAEEHVRKNNGVYVALHELVHATTATKVTNTVWDLIKSDPMNIVRDEGDDRMTAADFVRGLAGKGPRRERYRTMPWNDFSDEIELASTTDYLYRLRQLSRDENFDILGGMYDRGLLPESQIEGLNREQALQAALVRFGALEATWDHYGIQRYANVVRLIEGLDDNSVEFLTGVEKDVFLEYLQPEQNEGERAGDYAWRVMTDLYNQTDQKPGDSVDPDLVVRLLSGQIDESEVYYYGDGDPIADLSQYGQVNFFEYLSEILSNPEFQGSQTEIIENIDNYLNTDAGLASMSLEQARGKFATMMGNPVSETELEEVGSAFRDIYGLLEAPSTRFNVMFSRNPRLMIESTPGVELEAEKDFISGLSYAKRTRHEEDMLEGVLANWDQLTHDLDIGVVDSKIVRGWWEGNFNPGMQILIDANDTEDAMKVAERLAAVLDQDAVGVATEIRETRGDEVPTGIIIKGPSSRKDFNRYIDALREVLSEEDMVSVEALGFPMDIQSKEIGFAILDTDSRPKFTDELLQKLQERIGDAEVIPAIINTEEVKSPKEGDGKTISTSRFTNAVREALRKSRSTYLQSQGFQGEVEGDIKFARGDIDSPEYAKWASEKPVLTIGDFHGRKQSIFIEALGERDPDNPDLDMDKAQRRYKGLLPSEQFNERIAKAVENLGPDGIYDPTVVASEDAADQPLERFHGLSQGFLVGGDFDAAELGRNTNARSAYQGFFFTDRLLANTYASPIVSQEMFEILNSRLDEVYSELERRLSKSGVVPADFVSQGARMFNGTNLIDPFNYSGEWKSLRNPNDWIGLFKRPKELTTVGAALTNPFLHTSSAAEFIFKAARDGTAPRFMEYDNEVLYKTMLREMFQDDVAKNNLRAHPTNEEEFGKYINYGNVLKSGVVTPTVAHGFYGERWMYAAGVTTYKRGEVSRLDPTIYDAGSDLPYSPGLQARNFLDQVSEMYSYFGGGLLEFSPKGERVAEGLANKDFETLNPMQKILVLFDAAQSDKITATDVVNRIKVLSGSRDYSGKSPLSSMLGSDFDKGFLFSDPSTTQKYVASNGEEVFLPTTSQALQVYGFLSKDSAFQFRDKEFNETLNLNFYEEHSDEVVKNLRAAGEEYAALMGEIFDIYLEAVPHVLRNMDVDEGLVSSLPELKEVKEKASKWVDKYAEFEQRHREFREFYVENWLAEAQMAIDDIVNPDYIDGPRSVLMMWNDAIPFGDTSRYDVFKDAEANWVESMRAVMDDLGPKIKKEKSTAKVRMRMQNPKYINMRGSRYRETTYNDHIEQAKAEGHDGVVFLNTYDAMDQSYDEMADIFVVFNADDIWVVDAKERTSKVENEIRVGERPAHLGTGPVYFSRLEVPGIGEFDAADLGQIKKGLVANFQKYFSSERGLPQGVFRKYLQRKGRVEAEQDRAAKLLQDLRQLVKNSYPAASDQEKVLNDLNTLLGMPTDIVDGSNPLSGGPHPLTQSIPPAILAVLKNMRAAIDRMSQTMVEDLDLPEGLQLTINDNLGFYLRRTYKAFKEPEWARNVPQEIKTRFVNEVMREYRGIFHKRLSAPAKIRTSEGTLIDNPDHMTESQLQAMAQALMDTILYRAGDTKSPIGMLASMYEAKDKNVDIFMKRKLGDDDFSLALRALLGEEMDIFKNFTGTITRMAQVSEGHKMVEAIRDQGLANGWLRRGDDLDGTDGFIALTSENAYDPTYMLNGLYAKPETKEALDVLLQPSTKEASALMRFILRGNSITKYGKTVLSPLTHVRNFFGNVPFLVANGYINQDSLNAPWRDYFRTASAGNDLFGVRGENFRDRYRRLVELGVVNYGYEVEVETLLNDSGVNETLGGLLTRVGRISRGIEGSMSKLANKPQKLYSFEDDIFKVIAFELEAGRLKKAYPAKTENEIEEMAAEIVGRTLPNYEMVPEVIKALRQIPLIGTFPSFTSELIRTGVGRIRQTRDELKSDNPEVRRVGRQRLSGQIMQAVLVPTILAKVFKAMSGVSDEEEKAIRRMLPYWNKNSVLLFTRTDDGEIQYTDYGYVDPFVYFRRPLIALFGGGEQNVDDALVSATMEVMRPFIGEEIFFGSVAEAVRNTDMNGRPIVDPGSGLLSTFKQGLEHIWAGVEPGIWSQGTDLIRAINGEVNDYGKRYRLGNVLLSHLTGFKTETINPMQSFMYRAMEFGSLDRELRMRLNRVAKRAGEVSDDELRDAVRTFNQNRSRLQSDMIGLVQGMRSLHYTDQQIRQALKASFVKGDVIDGFLADEFVPYAIKDDVLDSTLDRYSLMSKDLPLTKPGEAERRISVLLDEARRIGPPQGYRQGSGNRQDELTRQPGNLGN